MRFLLPLILCYSASAADLMDGIVKVESGGRNGARGDKVHGVPHSRGKTQIQKDAWNDACKRLHVRWRWETDAHDPAKTMIVSRNHLDWLRVQFKSATGRSPSVADDYALWNLGFQGYARRGLRITNTPKRTQRAASEISPTALRVTPTARLGMAATAREGAAPKLVTGKCGRTMTNSEDRGDSRERPATVLPLPSANNIKESDPIGALGNTDNAIHKLGSRTGGSLSPAPAELGFTSKRKTPSEASKPAQLVLKQGGATFHPALATSETADKATVRTSR
jgi:hypothetical protein